MGSMRKQPEDRNNRANPVYGEVDLVWDGKTRGPSLPKGYDWCEITKKWWDMIRNSPQAMHCQPTDWANLIDTARLHNRLWGTPGLKPAEQVALAGEIRRRTEAYGFTWADRRKYGINIITEGAVAEQAEQIARASAVDYYKKLGGKS